MPFEFFIAMRQLMSRERRALISIITGISILGVVIGVTALIAVIAVIDGAQHDYLAKLIDEFAHIEVWDYQQQPLDEYQAIQDLLRQHPEVIATAPVVKRYAMLKNDAGFSEMRNFRPVQILGIDFDQEQQVSRMASEEKIEYGKPVPSDGEIVVGIRLAQNMQIMVGSRVYALTGQVARTATGIVPKQSELIVAGVFRSGSAEIDSSLAYVNLPTAQRMNLMDNEVDFVHARVQDLDRANAVKMEIREMLARNMQNASSPFYGGGYIVRSWADLQPDLFRALKLEKLALFVILMLVVAVAGLNIIGTLILVTMEKTRQIGILRAMGCSRRSIAWIFVLQGALIGFVGTGLGVLFGLTLCWWLKYHFPIEIPEIYQLDGLPVLVQPATVAAIVLSSITVCLIASVIPAWQASRLRIVEALRHE